LVKGIPITRYCDENNLGTVTRLGLFVQVCQAIQHAHQKGIIPRDIKPSNVLVADHDGVPVPKIIDFGIAKATTDRRLTNKTVFTAFEQFIGTPAYMSPEQAELSGLDVDTRSDIYSLGVLLYELLTSKTPFEAKHLLEAGLDEVRRIIREEEPLRPSTRLDTLDEAEQTTVAKHRQSDPPKLVHLIRGDLDWIVMKALEKDRGRRYERANGLAMDVQRHLSDEPVVACPPSKLYRFQKLLRRNKLVFAAGAAVAFSPDGKLLASSHGDKAVIVWNVVTGVEVTEIRGLTDAVYCLAFSRDSKRILTGGAEKTIRAWDAATGREVLTLRGHGKEVYCVALSPDGKLIASGSRDKSVRIWSANVDVDPAVQTVETTNGPIAHVAFSRDGKELAWWSGNVQVWNVASGNIVRGLKSPHGQYGRFQFSPGGGLLAACCGNQVAIFRANSGQIIQQLSAGHDAYGVAFSPDGKLLAAGNSFKHDIKVWDTPSGQHRVTPESRGIRANRSASSRLAASASRFKSPCPGESIRSGLRQGHKLQRKN
jgi:DNA-binding beta-propeller fold protein YncE